VCGDLPAALRVSLQVFNRAARTRVTGHWDSLKIGNARADIDCWPRSATNCIDNIWTHYQRILDAGLKDDYPETFFDWRGLDEKTISSSPIWFLKDVWCVRPPQQSAPAVVFAALL
jgi:hypothetical protein